MLEVSRSLPRPFAEALLVFCVALFAGGTPAWAQPAPNICGSLNNHYGPYDYRTKKAELEIVERAHFTPEIEALIRGKTGEIGGDLAYTLHTSPNHHRALLAMTRLAEKMKMPQPRGSNRTVACFYDRAVRFTPDDTVVRVLYSQFLAKQDKMDEAMSQLEQAEFHAKDNAFSHYNIGLAYFELKKYDKALAQAHKAAGMGFERTELADLLKAANKWQDKVN